MKTQNFGRGTGFDYTLPSTRVLDQHALSFHPALQNYRENRENGAEKDSPFWPFPSAGLDTLSISRVDALDWSNKWPDPEKRYWWKLTLKDGRVINDFYWKKDESRGWPDKNNKDRYWLNVYHTDGTKIEGFSLEPNYSKGFPDTNNHYWRYIQYTESGAIKQWMEEKDLRYSVRMGSTNDKFQFDYNITPMKSLSQGSSVIALTQLSNGHLASGDYYGRVRLWDVKKGECIKSFVNPEAHSTGTTSIIQLSDGRLVSGAWDGKLKLWDLEKGTCINTFDFPTKKQPVYSLIQLFDGRVISGSAKRGLELWDMNGNGCYLGALSTRESSALKVIQLTDGRVVGGFSDGTLEVWDVRKGICLKTFNQVSEPDALIQGGDGILIKNTDKKHPVGVYSLIQLKDARVVVGLNDATIRLWDIDKGTYEILKGHRGIVNDLIQLADNRLVSASWDKTIKFWDVHTTKCLGTIEGGINEGHTNYVFSLTQLADGRLVSGAHDKNIKIWDVEQNKDIRYLARMGDVEAKFKLAQRYETGNGVIKKSITEAIFWYEEAAKLGHADACFVLGTTYFRDHFKLSRIQAVEWLQRSTELGNIAAVEELQALANKGDANAQYALKQLLSIVPLKTQNFGLSSEGANRINNADREGAYRSYRIKAVEDYRLHRENGADIDAPGRPFPPYNEADFTTVVDSAGLYYIRYNEGSEIKKWMEEKDLRYRARIGDAEAKFELAQRYEKGNSVKKDMTEAIVWYQKAAKLNHANACLTLGEIYLHGRGVEANTEQAIVWFQQAAELGKVRAVDALQALAKKGVAKAQHVLDRLPHIAHLKTQGFGRSNSNTAVTYCKLARFKNIVEALENYIQNRENGNEKDIPTYLFSSAYFNLFDIKSIKTAGDKRADADVWPDAEGRHWWRLTLNDGRVIDDFYFMKDEARGWPDTNNKDLFWFTVHHAPSNTTIEGFALAHDYKDKEGYAWRYVQYTECGAIKQWMEEKDFRYLARIGDAATKFELAQRYETGNGVKKDVAEAIVWYKQAAKLNHAGAYLALGKIHAYAGGLEANAEEAKDNYFNKLWEGIKPNSENKYVIACSFQQAQEYLRTPILALRFVGKLENHEIEQLALQIRDHQTLLHLELSNCGITAAKIVYLANTVLKHNKVLQRLDLSFNPLGDEGVAILAEGLKENTSLNWLDLSRVGMTAEGAKSLSDKLAKNKGLTGLVLNGNLLGDHGVNEALIPLLKLSRFSALSLNNCAISDEGMKVLAQSLTVNTALTLLDLSNDNASLILLEECKNAIGNDGAKAIADALTTQRSLVHLRLAHNQIDKQGVEAFAAALKENPALIELDLQGNPSSEADKASFDTIQAYLVRNQGAVTQVFTACEARRWEDAEKLLKQGVSLLSEKPQDTLPENLLQMAVAKNDIQLAAWLLKQKNGYLLIAHQSHLAPSAWMLAQLDLQADKQRMVALLVRTLAFTQNHSPNSAKFLDGTKRFIDYTLLDLYCDRSQLEKHYPLFVENKLHKTIQDDWMIRGKIHDLSKFNKYLDENHLEALWKIIQQYSLESLHSSPFTQHEVFACAWLTPDDIEILCMLNAHDAKSLSKSSEKQATKKLATDFGQALSVQDWQVIHFKLWYHLLSAEELNKLLSKPGESLLAQTKTPSGETLAHIVFLSPHIPLDAIHAYLPVLIQYGVDLSQPWVDVSGHYGTQGVSYPVYHLTALPSIRQYREVNSEASIISIWENLLFDFCVTYSAEIAVPELSEWIDTQEYLTEPQRPSDFLNRLKFSDHIKRLSTLTITIPCSVLMKQIKAIDFSSAINGFYAFEEGKLTNDDGRTIPVNFNSIANKSYYEFIEEYRVEIQQTLYSHFDKKVSASFVAALAKKDVNQLWGSVQKYLEITQVSKNLMVQAFGWLTPDDFHILACLNRLMQQLPHPKIDDIQVLTEILNESRELSFSQGQGFPTTRINTQGWSFVHFLLWYGLVDIQQHAILEEAVKLQTSNVCNEVSHAHLVGLSPHLTLAQVKAYLIILNKVGVDLSQLWFDSRGEIGEINASYSIYHLIALGTRAKRQALDLPNDIITIWQTLLDLNIYYHPIKNMPMFTGWLKQQKYSAEIEGKLSQSLQETPFERWMQQIALLSPITWPTPYEYARLSQAVYDETQQVGDIFSIKVGCYQFDWKVIKIYLHEKSSYFAVAYVDENRKHLVLAHQGTSPSVEDVVFADKDVKADIEMIIKTRYATQKESIQGAISDCLRISLDEGWILSTTGHSLGGWAAIDAAVRLATISHSARYIHTVAFDPPGYQAMFEWMTSGFQGMNKGTLLERMDITSYFGPPNIVNTYGNHIQFSHRCRLYPSLFVVSSNDKKLFNTPISIEHLLYVNITQQSHPIEALLTAMDENTGYPKSTSLIKNWPVVEPSASSPQGFKVMMSIIAPVLIFAMGLQGGRRIMRDIENFRYGVSIAASLAAAMVGVPWIGDAVAHFGIRNYVSRLKSLMDFTPIGVVANYFSCDNTRLREFYRSFLKQCEGQAQAIQCQQYRPDEDDTVKTFYSTSNYTGRELAQVAEFTDLREALQEFVQDAKKHDANAAVIFLEKLLQLVSKHSDNGLSNYFYLKENIYDIQNYSSFVHQVKRATLNVFLQQKDLAASKQLEEVLEKHIEQRLQTLFGNVKNDRKGILQQATLPRHQVLAKPVKNTGRRPLSIDDIDRQREKAFSQEFNIDESQFATSSASRLQPGLIYYFREFPSWLNQLGRFMSWVIAQPKDHPVHVGLSPSVAFDYGQQGRLVSLIDNMEPQDILSEQANTPMNLPCVPAIWNTNDQTQTVVLRCATDNELTFVFRKINHEAALAATRIEEAAYFTGDTYSAEDCKVVNLADQSAIHCEGEYTTTLTVSTKQAPQGLERATGLFMLGVVGYQMVKDVVGWAKDVYKSMQHPISSSKQTEQYEQLASLKCQQQQLTQQLDTLEQAVAQKLKWCRFGLEELGYDIEDLESNIEKGIVKPQQFVATHEFLSELVMEVEHASREYSAVTNAISTTSGREQQFFYHDSLFSRHNKQSLNLQQPCVMQIEKSGSSCGSSVSM